MDASSFFLSHFIHDLFISVKMIMFAGIFDDFEQNIT